MASPHVGAAGSPPGQLRRKTFYAATDCNNGIGSPTILGTLVILAAQDAGAAISLARGNGSACDTSGIDAVGYECASMLTNLRMDPFELAPNIGMDYGRWFAEHMFRLMGSRLALRQM